MTRSSPRGNHSTDQARDCVYFDAPSRKEAKVFEKKNLTTSSSGAGSTRRAQRDDSCDGDAESDKEEKVGGHSNDNDDHGTSISTVEVEVAFVDKTPAEGTSAEGRFLRSIRRGGEDTCDHGGPSG